MICLRTSYVNGRYVPHQYASVSIEDRGFQFSDGVYEVITMRNLRLLDGDAHFKRLERSLQGLNITGAKNEVVLRLIIQELARQNRVRDAFVYIQITRGIAKREHHYTENELTPSHIITLMPYGNVPEDLLVNGAAITTVKENRWLRRDIKSISLLPNIMAKQDAVKQNTKEAWFIDDNNQITEGSSTNAFIIDKHGTLRTHPSDNYILSGVTRDVVLKLAKEQNITIQEQAFTYEQAKEANEAFMTSTTKNIVPVTQIDGHTIGGGKPGATSKSLMDAYKQHISTECYH